MLLGLDDENKKLKNALQITGADMSVVKNWLKCYEKTKKQSAVVAGKYYKVRDELTLLLKDMEQIERFLIDGGDLTGDNKGMLQNMYKEINKMQGDFNNEFLVSKADRDFQTTLQSVLDLIQKYLDGNSDKLIFQSEVENLIANTKEGLGREHPDLFALAFFYQQRSDQELSELPFPEKIDKIKRVYANEFWDVMHKELEKGIGSGEAMYNSLKDSSVRKEQKIVDELDPLLVMKDQDISAGEKATLMLKEMCSLNSL